MFRNHLVVITGASLVFGLGAVGCDDTADAIQEESAEEAREMERAGDRAELQAEQAKQEVKEAARNTAEEAREAADEAEESVDQADKALAEEIREED